MSRLTALAKARDFIAKNPKSSLAAAVGALGGAGALTALYADKDQPLTQPKPPGVPPITTPPIAPPPEEGKKTPSSADSANSVNKPGPAGAGDLGAFYKETFPGLLKVLGEERTKSLKENLESQLILQQATEEIGMKKTLEQSRRQIELENIKAWRDITTAQYNANAQIGLGMAEIAFRATQPNPGVSAATSAFARTAQEAFGGKLR